jgi:tetratricopeptide (TPR) repeat protein
MRFGLCILASEVLGMMVFMALAAPVATAHAQTDQSDDERARTHFEAGRSYYEQAQYEDATREFQESYDLSGRPELLLNISQSEERALHYDAAIDAARRYLVAVPNADNRKTVEERITSLQDLKKRYDEGGPAPLAPPGDSSNLTPLPGQPTSPTSPNGPSAGTTSGPAAGVAPPTAAGLGAEAQAGPDVTARGPQSEHESKLTIPAIVLMGTGGAALVGALVTGLVAHADYNSLERQCRANLCPSSARDELDEGKTLSVVSTVLTIVGVVAAGAGGALLFIGSQADEQADVDHRSARGERAAPRAGQVRLGPGLTPLSVSGKLSF